MDPAQDPNGASATQALQTASTWSAFLTEALDNPVEVSFGRARRQVVQCKGFWKDPTGRPIQIRLSSFFQTAPEEVRSALATWLRHGKRSKKACALLDAFIAQELRQLPRPKRRACASQTAGLHHDLAPLLLSLTQGPAREYTPADFAPRGLPTLAWGRRQRSRAKRSLQLGSYTEDQHHIRIHPVLDQERVPPFVLRFVLFHELLHAQRSTASENTPTRLHHDRAFRTRESTYPDFTRAQAWQEKHIRALLRSARTGRNFTPRRFF